MHEPMIFITDMVSVILTAIIVIGLIRVAVMAVAAIVKAIKKKTGR